MFRFNTVRSKVLVTVISIVFLSMAALGTFMTIGERNAILGQLDQNKNEILHRMGSLLIEVYGSAGFSWDVGSDGHIEALSWSQIPNFISDEQVEMASESPFGVASVLRLERDGRTFLRVSTSFKRDNGGRLTGSTLSNAAAVETLLRGEEFTGPIEIGGTTYYVTLVPTLGKNGTVTGALEAGLPYERLTTPVNKLIKMGILFTILLLMVPVIATLWIVPRALRPLGEISTAMQAVADGRHDTEIPHVGMPDAVGDIAKTLQQFATALAAAETAQNEHMLAQQEEAKRATREGEIQQRVVREISQALERMATGDLTQKIDSPANDPFPTQYETLRESYNSVLSRLAQSMIDINEVASGVRDGASEIDSAAGDLATRAETQAATLEQSAAALNQLTESVRSTSESVGQAEEASRGNYEQAETGARVVKEAIEAMQAIEASSESINRIIGVLDDIAFQTNLLALNAGVEAARAGEAGRGFAVVASEVRSLAQRASESAREIKALISESSEQVDKGSKLVSRTGEYLAEILNRASGIQEIMSDIAGAALEQASGLDEINNGVNQLDSVTQQNAAVAEEANAAAAALTQKSRELSQILSKFRTGEESGEVIQISDALQAAPATARQASETFLDGDTSPVAEAMGAAENSPNWAVASEQAAQVRKASVNADGSAFRDF